MLPTRMYSDLRCSALLPLRHALLHQTGVEAVVELSAVEILADEHHLVHSLLLRVPRLEERAVKQHVNGLEDVLVRAAIDGQDTLAAVDVSACNDTSLLVKAVVPWSRLLAQFKNMFLPLVRRSLDTQACILSRSRLPWHVMPTLVTVWSWLCSVSVRRARGGHEALRA